MGKYIDTARIDWRLIIPSNVTTAEENMIYRARKLVESQPTADVVEVGRCGECKFTDGTGAIEDGRHWCVLHESFMYYCSDFEREVNDEQIH